MMRSGREKLIGLVRRGKALAGVYRLMLAGVIVLTLTFAIWLKSAQLVEGKEYLLLSFRAADINLGKKVAVMAVITYAEIKQSDDKRQARGESERTIRVPWDALKYDQSLPVDRIVFDGYRIQGRSYTLVRWKPNSVIKAEVRPRMR